MYSTKQKNGNTEVQATPSYYFLEDDLLTPENFKNMRPQNNLKSQQSTQSFNIQISPSKTQQSELSPLKSMSNQTNTSSKNQQSKKNTEPKTPTKEERFAGAAFSNSPAPSSLPLPHFQAENVAPNHYEHSQPKKLEFSPTKNDSIPVSSLPKSILKNNTKNRPTTPPKKYQPKPTNGSVNARTTTPVSMPISSSPPTHDTSNLDQLSNHLKMMLKIGVVQS